MSKLVKPREDPTVMLQLADKAFHQMPLTIPVAVILPLLFRALMRRDHRFCSTPNYHLNERLSRIPALHHRKSYFKETVASPIMSPDASLARERRGYRE